MNLKFAKSKWELGESSLETFVQRVRKDGFDATEIYLQSLSEKAEAIREIHDRYGLDFIAQIITVGKTPDEHVASFERQFERAERRGILLRHETHRGRPTYSAVETRKYLEALPIAEIP